VKAATLHRSYFVQHNAANTKNNRKPNFPQTLTRVWTVLPCCPDGCTKTLESSRTLKSVWMCCHDVRTDVTLNCSKLLDIDGSLDGIASSSEQMLLTNEHPNALLGRPDGNKGSDFY
jgi:hypothetical protein